MRLLPVLLVLIALAVAGCGSGSSSETTASTTAAPTASTNSPAHLAAAKFVLHAGLAFGAFHRYIYKPLKAGAFKGLLRHKLTVLKATAAAVFIVHELKLATADAKASPQLSKLTTQLTLLSAGFGAALRKLKAGNFNPLEIETASGAITGIERAAASSGTAIAESSPAVP